MVAGGSAPISPSLSLRQLCRAGVPESLGAAHSQARSACGRSGGWQDSACYSPCKHSRPSTAPPSARGALTQHRPATGEHPPGSAQGPPGPGHALGPVVPPSEKAVTGTRSRSRTRSLGPGARSGPQGDVGGRALETPGARAVRDCRHGRSPRSPVMLAAQVPPAGTDLSPCSRPAFRGRRGPLAPADLRPPPEAARPFPEGPAPSVATSPHNPHPALMEAPLSR